MFIVTHNHRSFVNIEEREVAVKVANLIEGFIYIQHASENLLIYSHKDKEL